MSLDLQRQARMRTLVKKGDQVAFVLDPRVCHLEFSHGTVDAVRGRGPEDGVDVIVTEAANPGDPRSVSYVVAVCFEEITEWEPVMEKAA